MFILACLLTRNNFARFVNERCIVLKFILALTLTFALLFVPNDYLIFYVKIASFISLLFLLYQSIALIDFGYIWNEKWVENYDLGSNFHGIMLICSSAILLILSVICIGFNFSNFWISGCIYNKINILANIIIISLLLFLVYIRINQNCSVLTALFVSLVFTYYNGISLSSFSDTKCNPFASTHSEKNYLYDSMAHIVVNLSLAFLSIFYCSTADQTSKNFKEAHISYNHANNTTDATISNRSLIEELDEEQIRSHIHREFRTSTIMYKGNEYIIFHGLMALFSIYLVMLFFDWRTLNLDSGSWTQLVAPSTSSFLIKTFTSIAFLLFYVWTLIAPRFYKERDFN